MIQRLVFFFLLYTFVMVAETSFAEGKLLFPDRYLTELVLIETDPETGSFSFIDDSGEIQDGAIGDLVSVKELTVVEVLDIQIIAASYEEYDWYGTTRTRTNTINIPKARIFEVGKGIR